MLSMIKGEVHYRGNGFIVLEKDGFGYKILIPETIMSDMTGEIVLYTHEVVREDRRELFGFNSLEALELFWKLISISGVGPRIAQKIVCSRAIPELRSSIMVGNLTVLTDLPGVGTKIGQKIILELKGVLAKEPEVNVEDEETLDALVSMGYPRKQAEQVIAQLPEDCIETEDRVRAVLKYIGGK